MHSLVLVEELVLIILRAIVVLIVVVDGWVLLNVIMGLNLTNAKARLHGHLDVIVDAPLPVQLPVGIFMSR